MSYDLPKPVDYSKTHYTLYTAAGGKRANLCNVLFWLG